MFQLSLSIILTSFLITLMGCATTVVPRPSTITLEQAMRSVGSGLVELKEAEKGLKTGLIADEVEVTFNISASGKDGLTVEVTPIALEKKEIAKIGSKFETTYAAQRGNQITIKFKNIVTANAKDTICKNVDDLEKLIKLIKTTK